MIPFTFVHAADLHLDAPFRGAGALLSDAARGEKAAALLRRATFTALARLVRLCVEAKADFLLLAGDVYNAAESSLRARLALRDAFLELRARGIQVFLAHGNHDPFAGEDAAIPWPDNVTVFTGKTECHTAARGGVPLALVHGVSHTRAREERNLARQFQRRETPPQEAELFQIGLLHCFLDGCGGRHEAYAPCSPEDLAATGLDYWALGHVHGWRILTRQGEKRPYAAYSGSLQGLHVNESGPRGCLLAHVDREGRVDILPIPLAPVRWEILTVGLGGNDAPADIPALETLLLERLSALAPAVFNGEKGHSVPLGNSPLDPLRDGAVCRDGSLVGLPGEVPGDAGGGLMGDTGGHMNSEASADGDGKALYAVDGKAPDESNGRRSGRGNKEAGGLPAFLPEAVIVRLTLEGRSDLDHELRRPGALEDLAGHLGAELGESGVWIRDIALETRPPLDLESLSRRPDLAGEAWRLARLLRENPEALAAFAKKALLPLKKGRLQKAVSAPDAEELARIAEEAAFLCLDLLEGE